MSNKVLQDLWYTEYFVKFWSRRNRKSSLTKGNKIGAIFMDLSEIFNALEYSTLIAKLRVCSFDIQSLEFVENYLTNRK